MIGKLNRWLQVPITIINPGKINSEGDRLEPTEFHTKCFLIYDNKLILSLSGKQIVSNTTVYLDNVDYGEIKEEETMVKLPDNKSYEVMRKYVDYDRFGNISMVRLML